MTRPDVGGGPAGQGPNDEFDREAEILRSLRDEPVELVDAPDGLWESIAAAVEADENVAPVVDSERGAQVGSTRFTVHDGSVEPTAPAGGAARKTHASRWRTAIVGVAAAIAVVAVAAGVLVSTRSDGPTELAAAVLTPFDGAAVGDAGGSVELIEDDGRITLRVDMHDLPAPEPGTFYELWLLDTRTGEPVSVATMKDGSSDVTTDIDVPPGTDPDRFDVVDVSVQEDSAGPEHSGNSVLRGTLST